MAPAKPKQLRVSGASSALPQLRQLSRERVTGKNRLIPSIVKKIIKNVK